MEAEMYLNVMDCEKKRIVAVCDAVCIGQVYEEGERKLDLEEHRGFYEGELADEERILAELKKADSVNLVGERAVGVGLDAGVIEEENIATISGIPHAQGYRIDI